VLTEAMYLLRSAAQAQRVLWDMLGVGGVQLIELGIDDCPRMRELMWKYRDLPMDLADAALVRVAERKRIRRVFTVDRRDSKFTGLIGSAAAESCLDRGGGGALFFPPISRMITSFIMCYSKQIRLSSVDHSISYRILFWLK
jgi:hypothetical protein